MRNELFGNLINLIPIIIKKGEKNIILILDIRLLIRHFPLQNKIAQIPLNKKPLKKLPKRQLPAHNLRFIPLLNLKQNGNMTGPRNVLNLGEVVFPGLFRTAIVLFAELIDEVLEGWADELADYLLGYVAADVLLVVAFVVLFLLF